MISVNSVSKKFESKVAIDKVSFDLEPGKIFGLLGPNGAGKTTLIRMLLDIIKPDEGSILFEGHSLRSEDKNNIGYLPEERGLYKNQKVMDTLIYLGRLKGMSKEKAEENAEYYLLRFDMHSYKNYKLSALSKGLQQKIQFIATILFEPTLIILDEPFSGLDPLNTRIMKELIQELKRQDRIIILSTHQMNQVEKLCDTVFILNNGRQVISGSLQEVREKYSKNEFLINSTADYSSFNTIEKDLGNLDGKKHLILKNGFNSKDLLKELFDSNCEIIHFEKRLVPIEDIFINLISNHVDE